jgi:hypothetical protein
MALNGLGTEKKQQPAPVSLPVLSLPDDDDRAIEEAASRIAERRTIRIGRDAWESVTKAESFVAWKAIGAALAIGKTQALRVTGVNQAWGSRYSRVFGDWMKLHGFDLMPKSMRSVAIEMHENISEIEKWRATLTDKQRRRLAGPLQNVRRWRRETGQTKSKCDDNALKAAAAAWRRFVSCVEALPPDQAAPLWGEVQAKAAAIL